MNSSSYSIQEFVTRVLESHGALVEQTGYALVEVILPDKLLPLFNGRSFLRLAFDYEVSRETEGCEFVTYGSYLLDTVTKLALSTGRVAECYVPVERLELPPRAEEKAARKIDFVKCRPPQVEDWYLLECVYYRYNFRCIYQYDEKREDLQPVLVDMHSGRQDREVQLLLPLLENVVHLEERQHILPRPPVISQDEAYKRACAAAAVEAEKVIKELEKEQAGVRERELAKVIQYYESTRRELQDRLARTRDEARRERLQKQIAATEADQQRRVRDVREKFSVECEIFLDSVVIYYLPKFYVNLKVQQRDEVFNFQVIFNPLSREVETPLCPACGRPARRIFRQGGTLHCGCLQ